jgi:hypothetical protein
MPNWDEDSPILRRNLTRAARGARDAARRRSSPALALALGWHRQIMADLDVPDPRYVGQFRGPPVLPDCEVTLGPGLPDGVPSAKVGQALKGFETRLSGACRLLDGVVPKNALPTSDDEANAVIELCAWVHGEWVRIHPFANGNGRTARLWAGYVAMRYGIPIFVRLRPRPEGGYGDASDRAMTGDWRALVPVFRRMYRDLITGPAVRQVRQMPNKA